MRIPPKFDYGLTYYLAGPMSGYKEYNYPAFEANVTALRNEGVRVESPHTIPWPAEELPDEELWQHMMRNALRMLLGCTGIILMRGWTESRGAILEYNVAVSLKMPAYFLDGKYVVPMHDPNREALIQ